jgi:diaminopimelate decarboxylase
MSSNYNQRPRAAEVMVDGRRWQVVRERETAGDLLRGERLFRAAAPAGRRARARARARR